jgi:asparagine synthetase B (glutamine-hydrolysing)
MFGFAIWDRKNRKLFIARDRLGISLSITSTTAGVSFLAPKSRAVLAYPGVRREFNLSALAEYLAFGYVAGEQTMYAGIRKLLPGIRSNSTRPARCEFPVLGLNVAVDDGSLPQNALHQTVPRAFGVVRFRAT